MAAVFTHSVPFFSTNTNPLHLILSHASGSLHTWHQSSMLTTFTYTVYIYCYTDIIYCSFPLFFLVLFHNVFHISAFGYSVFTAFQYINW